MVFLSVIPAPSKYLSSFDILEHVLNLTDEQLENEKLVNRVTRALLGGGRSRKRSGDHLATGKDETSGKKKLFEVQLNVNGYKPEELCVKVSDGHILLEGKHEEIQKDENSEGYALKQFKKKIALPGNIIEDRLKCKLSSNGKVLEVTAPLKCLEPPPEPTVRTIPITVEKPAIKGNQAKEIPSAVERKGDNNADKSHVTQNEQKEENSSTADSTCK